MDCRECDKDCPNPLNCEDYLADVKGKIFCIKCGKDVTKDRFLYVHGKSGGRYCYDCAEKEKQRKKKTTGKRAKALRLRKSGMKPSEIAKEMGITTERVYGLLSK